MWAAWSELCGIGWSRRLKLDDSVLMFCAWILKVWQLRHECRYVVLHNNGVCCSSRPTSGGSTLMQGGAQDPGKNQNPLLNCIFFTTYAPPKNHFYQLRHPLGTRVANVLAPPLRPTSCHRYSLYITSWLCLIFFGTNDRKGCFSVLRASTSEGENLTLKSTFLEEKREGIGISENCERRRKRKLQSQNFYVFQLTVNVCT
jgi:hypothetical protein